MYTPKRAFVIRNIDWVFAVISTSTIQRYSILSRGEGRGSFILTENLIAGSILKKCFIAIIGNTVGTKRFII